MDDDYPGTWRPSDEPCPECGSATEVAPWLDDLIENGGACIGTQHSCTACDWYVSR